MPDGLKAERPDQGKVQKLFISGFEVFMQGFQVVGGEGRKFFDDRPVPQVAGPDDFHPERNIKTVAVGRLLFLVIVGRQKMEGGNLETAFGGRFAEASLTEKENLLSFPNGRAD